ncbi:hypothetical protein DP120_04040 [Planococcus halotolerans]|uniref:Uncharacterized protein n=1 Tax=Planococcus halotolerans TaxID=2233542 RepID=A0A365L7Q2_9BACL|nr:hypothetical protein DP120_04040 [Planococcus halotolerans]
MDLRAIKKFYGRSRVLYERLAEFSSIKLETTKTIKYLDKITILINGAFAIAKVFSYWGFYFRKKVEWFAGNIFFY